MKKIITLLFVCISLLCFKVSAAVRTPILADTVGNGLKISKLTKNLGELRTELAEFRQRLPSDSAKMVDLNNQSLEAQRKSKESAKDAVGGDVSDAKKAEKEAKKAEEATSDANDAVDQVNKDHKKIKQLLKDINKTQGKINKLQSAQS